MNNQNTNPTRIVLIYIIAFLLAASTFAIWRHTVNQWPYFAFNIKTEQDQLLINNVSPDKPADKAGLEPGDVILELAGIQMTPDVVKKGHWFLNSIKDKSLSPERTVSIVIERQGERIAKTITPMRYSDAISSKTDEIILFLFMSLLGLFLLIKKQDSRTHVLAFCLLALATFFGDTFVPRSMLSGFDLVRLIVFQASLFYSPLLLHFALIHPQPKSSVEKRKFAIALVYAPWILLFAYGLVKQLYTFFFANGKLTFWITQIEPYSEPRIILRFVVTLLFIGLVLHSFFKLRSGSYKRQATWMLVAVLFGLVPVFIIEFIQIFTAVAPFGSAARSALNIVDKALVSGAAVCFAWSVWLREGDQANAKAATDGLL